MRHETYEGEPQVKVILPDLKHIRTSKHHNNKKYVFRKKQKKKYHRDKK